MTERRDPTGPHMLPPPFVLREDTGSHRAQLPPPSDPPVTRRGPSWGALAAVCALLLLPSIAGLVQLGRVLEQLEQLREDVAPLAASSRTHETQLAVLRRDHDALERDFGKLERRGRREEDR
jgi:hypothetical protein